MPNRKATEGRKDFFDLYLETVLHTVVGGTAAYRYGCLFTSGWVKKQKKNAHVHLMWWFD